MRPLLAVPAQVTVLVLKNATRRNQQQLLKPTLIAANVVVVCDDK